MMDGNYFDDIAEKGVRVDKDKGINGKGRGFGFGKKDGCAEVIADGIMEREGKESVEQRREEIDIQSSNLSIPEEGSIYEKIGKFEVSRSTSNAHQFTHPQSTRNTTYLSPTKGDN